MSHEVFPGGAIYRGVQLVDAEGSGQVESEGGVELAPHRGHRRDVGFALNVCRGLAFRCRGLFLGDRGQVHHLKARTIAAVAHRSVAQVERVAAASTAPPASCFRFHGVKMRKRLRICKNYFQKSFREFFGAKAQQISAAKC